MENGGEEKEMEEIFSYMFLYDLDLNKHIFFLFSSDFSQFKHTLKERKCLIFPFLSHPLLFVFFRKNMHFSFHV